MLIREHDCIYCMACVSVCPPQAVLVDQSNVEWHEKGTELLSKWNLVQKIHTHTIRNNRSILSFSFYPEQIFSSILHYFLPRSPSLVGRGP